MPAPAAICRHWYFDIGAHVKQGDLLAEIDTPEVDEQLRQARADLATAQANLQLAEITAKRNEDLLKTNSVSTQDRDNAVGALAADKAIVASKQADVSRLEQLQSYEKVYAPFDGVITARNTDIGALIDAGANCVGARAVPSGGDRQGPRLRGRARSLYARGASRAPSARHARRIPGRARSTARWCAPPMPSIPPSRTLMVEVDVDNPDGKLLPGRLCLRPSDAAERAHPRRHGAVEHAALPQGRAAGRRGAERHGAARADQHRPRLRHQGRGRLRPAGGDEVILDPSDSLTDGTAVRVQPPAPAGPAQ